MVKAKQDFRITMDELEANKDRLIDLVRVKLVMYEVAFGKQGYEKLNSDLDVLLEEME